MQALTIDSSSAIKVKSLTIQNAQQMHFIIARSDSVRVSGVQVSAPGDSPNTDGIHITESTNVVLENCKIGTGSYFILFFFSFVKIPYLSLSHIFVVRTRIEMKLKSDCDAISRG